MSLLPKSIHRCRRYPTKFNSGRDIPLRWPTSWYAWGVVSLSPQLAPGRDAFATLTDLPISNVS